MKDPDTTELRIEVEQRLGRFFIEQRQNEDHEVQPLEDFLDDIVALITKREAEAYTKGKRDGRSVASFNAELKRIEKEAYRAGQIAELEAFRANTGQYEIERDYPTPTGRKNWNTDIKVRNKLKMSLDNKIKDRVAELQSDNGKEVS